MMTEAACERLCRCGALMGMLLLATVVLAQPATQPVSEGAAYGPYYAKFLAAGGGLSKPLTPHDELLDPGAAWSLVVWVHANDALPADAVLAGVGDSQSASFRGVGTHDGAPTLLLGTEPAQLASGAGNGMTTLTPGAWHMLAAAFSGAQARLYVDGVEAGGANAGETVLAPELLLAPRTSSEQGQHLSGEEAGVMLLRHAIDSKEAESLYRHRPDFALGEFEEASPAWPVQTRGQAGLSAPQDPATLPRSRQALGTPVNSAAPVTRALHPQGVDRWLLADGWRLEAAPRVSAAERDISSAGFDSSGWMQAVVPGTVLTTMVARGIYPDPAIGLNNLAIPESLAHQDYWYREEFPTPPVKGRRLTLSFEGVNYAASVWLNGRHLGEVRGAFTRGTFDVTQLVKTSGPNVLAVRISPPPHPGIAHEQSIKAGPGDNGGIMTLDGPTFAATEGWDWIPGVRDRNMGLWQGVTLTASGALTIADPQVITTLPRHDTTEADVEIMVPVENHAGSAVRASVRVSFDNVNVTRAVTIPAGGAQVRFAPADYAQLKVMKPKLWWPNGYGNPDLHTLHIDVTVSGRVSSQRQLRFGMREISYELSLLDQRGSLKRVEYLPADAPGSMVVDESHQALRQTAAGWVASIAPGAESSDALRPLTDLRTAPYLVIRVNGVRIACKGGNWGMDDFEKRVSRERLEPYFRLHREANLNIIRNWMGQDTEETFYDLADEYGMLVWNDFWISTQNYNLEPSDAALFLDNAKDTILRFRNHPSIAVWCGRNEGVPPPFLNDGLARLTREVDGTRLYSASSNQVNLQNSGPYSYQPPSKFFTVNNRGFSVEVGTPSLPTLEALKAAIAPADLWPISDAWAYHDWHQSGNGDVAPFMREIATEFGEASSVEDFERKAQMLNYVDHRGIFEGFNAHLWAPNSGRMLWMTQPAWPSTMWQIYSSDYDTQASFYGVKSASEPVHVQMNLPDLHAAVVNNRRAAIDGATLTVRAVDLKGDTIFEHEDKVSVPSQSATALFPIEIGAAAAGKTVFVALELRDAGSNLLSHNFYWYSDDSAGYQQMNQLPQVPLEATVIGRENSGGETRLRLSLVNPARTVVLAAKLTLERPDGSRVLPAYYSDNYVSLMPGEKRVVEIAWPGTSSGPLEVAMRGWNVTPAVIAVTDQNR